MEISCGITTNYVEVPDGPEILRGLRLHTKTRKQNLQANSRSTCQCLAQQREGSTEVVREVAPSLLQGVEIERIFALPCVYRPQFLRY